MSRKEGKHVVRPWVRAGGWGALSIKGREQPGKNGTGWGVCVAKRGPVVIRKVMLDVLEKVLAGEPQAWNSHGKVTVCQLVRNHSMNEGEST